MAIAAEDARPAGCIAACAFESAEGGAVSLGSAGRQGNTGWHRVAQQTATGIFAEPVTPPEWELFLRSLGIAQARALAVADGSVPGPRDQMREWVEKWRGRRFVPEAVLRALGLELFEADVRLPSPADHGRWARSARPARRRALGD